MTDKELLLRMKKAAAELELAIHAGIRRDGFGSQAKLLESVAILGQVTTELITRKPPEPVWWKHALINFVSMFFAVLVVQLMS